MALRRTKIIATLGPATDSEESLKEIIAAGVDVVRCNFSHGTAQDHQNRIQKVRDISKKMGRVVAILADLQGPKIRISKFKNNKINLEPKQEFILDASLDEHSGDENQVGIDYKNLPNDVAEGDILLLDDGRLEFIVKKIENNKIYCDVSIGGELSNNKGINRKGGGLSAEALTEKDKADLITAVKLNVDYIAISFPRTAKDMEYAKRLVFDAGGSAGVIAKIERSEAVTCIDEIITASDGVMVARGDLGVEIGDFELPAVQKHIIQRARSLDKPVITATQMMESMITSPIPTRAEVLDVANAVLDGTDAVMLSAETATGDHPDKVIAAMVRICMGAERQKSTQVSKHRLECQFNRVDEAIAMAAMYSANHMDIKGIIALTESGSTPLWMSRIRSGLPIFGLSRHENTRAKMALYRGVFPIDFDATQFSADLVYPKAIETLVNQNLLNLSDTVIITSGDAMGIHGLTNTLKIIKVEDVTNHQKKSLKNKVAMEV